MSDSNGYTANIGLGAKYYLRDNVFLDFDTRYRYLRLLRTHSRSFTGISEPVSPSLRPVSR